MSENESPASPQEEKPADSPAEIGTPGASASPETSGVGAASAAGAPGGEARGGVASQTKVVVALAALLALAAIFWPRSAPKRDLSGVTLQDRAGQSRPLAGELQPVTLVHFWATWCPPCIDEIPSLLAYAREARQQDPRFQLLLVAVAEERAKAEAFVGETPFPLYFDGAWKAAHRFGTEKLPETHLVVGGEIVASFIGATDWSDPAVRAQIARALASL